MSLDLSALTDRVAKLETVKDSTVALLNHIVDELKDLRMQGGGALQPQIDDLTNRIQANIDGLSSAVAAGTAADAEVHGDQPSAGAGDNGPVPETDNATGEPVNRAQAAVDHLNDQSNNAPE